MTTQAATVRTVPADELARVTLVFTGKLARMTLVIGDAPPRLTHQPGSVAVEARRSRDPYRELIAALGNPSHPRYVEAVDALAAIGDGAATGALIKALDHTNSNVRWKVIRALAEIGDPRSIRALRRVASRDHAKTGWGEPVAKAALLALQELQARSILPRFADLITTVLVMVIMFGALLFAATHVRAMRAELRREVPVPARVASVTTIGTPDLLSATGNCPSSAARPASRSTAPAPEITGQVRVPVLPVRDRPRWSKKQIGAVHAGDSLIILEQCGNWYRVQLGTTHAASSRIKGGAGWIARFVVGVPGLAAPSATAARQPGIDLRQP